MTRIIAGFAGSLRLTVPATGTRPTSDRVREAIFSALAARDALVGCRVLDLYAGSGSLGLEAISRGATRVTLVDRSTSARRVLRDNIARVQRAAVGTEPEAEIVVSSQPVQSFLGGATGLWDLVFLDPPYELGAVEIQHNLEALATHLSPEAIVVLERSARDPAPILPGSLDLDRRTDYGDTALYWLSPAEPTSDLSQPAAPFQSA